MEQINNETLRTVLTLVGPAGLGLLLLAGALAYMCRELWRELKESREKFTSSLQGVTGAINNLSEIVKDRR